MLLAIDIGNTNINFAVFKSNRIIRRFFVPTESYCLSRIKKKLKNQRIDNTVICSVVPQVTNVLVKDLTRLLGRKPYIIGKDIRVPIKNLYRKPKQVGQDRLVNAYAGVISHCAPLIVIDFGTAVTLDVISRKKEYLGGMILPGLKLSLACLYEDTALLPKIKLERPKELIGKDTKQSILSGIVYGFAALTDNLVKKIKEKIGKNTRVIGTGGNISLVGKYCKHIYKIDKDLTLKGINLIYNNSKK